MESPDLNVYVCVYHMEVERGLRERKKRSNGREEGGPGVNNGIRGGGPERKGEELRERGSWEWAP